MKSSKRRNLLIEKRIITIVLLVLFILIVIFPFVLDYLYGQGKLKNVYNNSFSASDWFSFLGSYFPATIFGILTLYQAYIIQFQDKRYRDLIKRNCIIPLNQASVYRYNEDKKIKNYDAAGLRSDFFNDSNELICNWEKGYILEFIIINTADLYIKNIEIKEITWLIDNTLYKQEDVDLIYRKYSIESLTTCRVTIYWKISGTEEKIEENITQCMLASIREDIRFDNSIITVFFNVENELNEKIELKMKLRMQCTDNQFIMRSVEEKIFISES